MITVVSDMRRRWTTDPGSSAELTELHQRLAAQALDAMRDELDDMKDAALSLPTPPPPVFTPSASTPAIAP
jgi:hypothetical protein